MHQRILIPTMERTLILDSRQVLWLQANGNCAHIHLIGGERLTSTRILKRYSDLLHENGFYRIHDRYLVNLQYVSSFTRGERIRVIMMAAKRDCRWNNMELEVACRKKRKFLDFMNSRGVQTLIEETDTLIDESPTVIVKLEAPAQYTSEVIERSLRL